MCVCVSVWVHTCEMYMCVCACMYIIFPLTLTTLYAIIGSQDRQHR